MPILNTKGVDENGKIEIPTVEEEVGPFEYSNKKICEKQDGTYTGSFNTLSLSPFQQLRLDSNQLGTTDQLVCSGDARSVYFEYWNPSQNKDQLVCLDVLRTDNIYQAEYKDGYGSEFLCLDLFVKNNLGAEGGIYPNDQGPAFCMHPNNKLAACTAQGIYPFTTNPTCDLPTSINDGAIGNTIDMNVKRESVWNALQAAKDE